MTNVYAACKASLHYFSEIRFIHSISLCIMVGNAEAERVFSTMNRIKTNLRNRLQGEQLERLIRISHSKATRAQFEFDGAARIFFNIAPRRLQWRSFLWSLNITVNSWNVIFFGSFCGLQVTQLQWQLLSMYHPMFVNLSVTVSFSVFYHTINFDNIKEKLRFWERSSVVK